jgi:Glucose / Sorbosone dehydrogenase
MLARRILGTLVPLLLLALAATARGATLQSIGTFHEPIYVTSDPESGERLLVAEREGVILQLVGGVPTVLADLRPLVECNGACSGERGLLSIAPAPNFASSGRLYADYANSQDGVIHLAEVTLDEGEPAAVRAVLSIAHPGETNHNGGQLQFGPEGDLYLSTGDGGGTDDQHHNAQSLESLLGKVLRINPRPSPSLPYTVPADNPFAGAPRPYDAIWSYGLRNPFRFSFDRLSGAMVIADVGEAAREEIDLAPPGGGGGANYGWNCREGTIAGPATDPGCAEAPPGAFVEPVFDYPHTTVEGGTVKRCAIIGGYVVRDPGLPELAGRYLYGDRCTGEVRSLDLADPEASDRSEGLTVPELDSFGEDACGRVYAISQAGQVSRLVGSQPTPCPLAPTVVLLRAASRRVPRSHRAVLTAFLSPVRPRGGEPGSISLWETARSRPVASAAPAPPASPRASGAARASGRRSPPTGSRSRRSRGS